MPLGKWLALGILVGAVGAVGCGDSDNGTQETDSGSGGGTDSGAKDAGLDSGSEEDSGAAEDSGSAKDSGGSTAKDANVMCGDLVCMPYSPAKGVVPDYAPGCVTDYMDATACGLSTDSLLGPDASPAFILKDAPGADSESCAAFIDSMETVPDGGTNDAGYVGNGLIDKDLMIAGLTVHLTYPGCCTPLGYCSGATDKGKSSLAGGAPTDSNSGFGCMQPDVFFASVGVPVMIPCDPDTGMIKVPSGDGGTGDGGAGDAGTDAGDGG